MNNQPPSLYYLPPDTAPVIQQHIKGCQNLALVLDKYVQREVIDEGRRKGDWLRERLQNNTLDKQLAQNVYRRWLRMMKSLGAVRFELALDWRMVVGLGGETVLETDITLHHLYGLPIIPGSALKGLTRAYVAGEEKEYFIIPPDKPGAAPGPSLEEKTDHPDIQRIFGMQKQAGTVLFFDALPTNGEAAFVVDIMNPHYPEYYRTLQSKTITPPTNDQSPNPIAFLAVMNTTFTFALAARDPNNQRHKDDVELVREWLQKALQKYGVGGKTSAGYGYFREAQAVAASENTDNSVRSDNSAPPQSPPVDPDMRRADGYKRELDALKNVAGEIYGYYQKWQQLTSQEARLLLARAIVETVRRAGREKTTAEKAWYQELQAFLREE
jgi:CRISPR type III-B/RAMP module RAMP protein Cmr6